ncbi:hypothetical protein DNTS_007683 [Danionella cerebrum]|uniref:J domain-containing protein n=1 Tax=Danionella cerebrum TaxID=2873325 RepID=A0A553QB42_9TELE|nr:hypothetical protein DNTS_007683 [Danionella translucida]
MGLLDQCVELFKTINLYDVLGVSKEATDSEIRRGYYKVSLQVLGKVYAVLTDKEQRSVYDEQGIVDEESECLDQDRNWEEHWRRLFPKITLQDIMDFEKQYKGSDEELKDLKRLYLQHEGDMDLIMQSALCGSYEDEPRVKEILQKAIDAKEVPAHKAFTDECVKKENMRKRKAEKERKQAEEMRAEMGLDNEDSLVAMIQKRQKAKENGFNSLIANLEAKYCKKPAAGKKGKKK